MNYIIVVVVVIIIIIIIIITISSSSTVQLRIQDVLGLYLFLLPSKVHRSAVLVHDWRTFRSTCPTNFRWCLVKCADPKKNSEPPPRLHERFCLPWRKGGGRGSEAWFRYFTLLCILRPPYPI